MEECVDLAVKISETCPHLALSGVMTIGEAPDDETDPTAPNMDFQRLKACKTRIEERLGMKGEELDLSAGMSDDFVQPIEQVGATNVRVGSRIFGARVYLPKPAST